MHTVSGMRDLGHTYLAELLTLAIFLLLQGQDLAKGYLAAKTTLRARLYRRTRSQTHQANHFQYP